MATVRIFKPGRAPEITYTAKVKRLIDALVDGCSIEIFWLGVVEKEENGDMTIVEIFVPKQTCTAASVEVEDDAMAETIGEVISAGYDTSQLCYWGHSHVNMAVNPSGVDDDQAEDFLQTMPVLIRGIYNKKGDSRVDVIDRDNNLQWENCKEFVESETSNDELAFVKESLGKVVKYTPPLTNWTQKGGSTYNGKPRYTAPAKTQKATKATYPMDSGLYTDDEWDKLTEPYGNYL